MFKGCIIVYTQPLNTAVLRVGKTQGYKKLELTSPSLPTVLLNTPAEDSPTTIIIGGDWASAREARNLSVLARLGRLQR